MAIETSHFEELDNLFFIVFSSSNATEVSLKEYVQAIKQKMKDWIDQTSEIEAEDITGISVHSLEDGLTYYAAIQVKESSNQLPKEMKRLEIPVCTYFVAYYNGEESLSATYERIAAEIKKHDYEPYITTNTPIFDSLPIKIEKYPLNETKPFKIYIPVVKKL